MGTEANGDRTRSPGRAVLLAGAGVVAVIVVLMLVVGGGLAALRTGGAEDRAALEPLGGGGAINVDDRERDPSIGLELSVGFGDAAPVGATVPAFVTVSPTRPLQGELWMSTSGETATTTVLDIDVAAGATKQWVVAVPASADDAVSAAVLTDDAYIDEVVRRDFQATAQLAGILGDDDFTARVGAVTDPFTGDVWSTAVIDAAVLDQPAAVLESIATLVATHDALAGLSDAARVALDTAVVVDGMHLVVTNVTSDPGIGRAPAAMLDGRFVPTGAAFPLLLSQDGVRSGEGDRNNGVTAVAGTGRVTWLGDVPRDVADDPRTWGDLWTGSPAASQRAQSQVPVDTWLLLQDGITLPSSWAMSGFALVWMLLVGLVAARISRSDRRMRGWLVLPAMSLLLASTAFVLAQGTTTSGGRSLAAGRWVDGAGRQEVMLVQVPDADPLEFAGPGWLARTTSWEHTARGRPDSDGLTVEVQSDFGGATAVWASRATPQVAPATIEAVVTAAGTRAEITVGRHALSDARVVAPDGRAVDVGDLAANSTIVVEVGVDARVDGVPSAQAGGEWSPTTHRGEHGEDGEDKGSWARSTRRLVDRNDHLVWLLATGDDVLDGDPGRDEPDRDVLSIGVTPTVQAPATLGTATTAWQAQVPRDDGRIEPETNRIQDFGEVWVRVALPTPASVNDVQLTISAARDGACDRWMRTTTDGGGNTDALNVDLCDGESPECPEAADFCERWDQGMSWCADDVCENWDRLDGPGPVWEAWAAGTMQWRALDAAGIAAVESDPGGFLTPLGDMVFKVDVRGGSVPLDPVELEASG